jgi:hypothetical protein
MKGIFILIKNETQRKTAKYDRKAKNNMRKKKGD